MTTISIKNCKQVQYLFFLPKVFLKVVILAATWTVAIDTETIFTFSDTLAFYSSCDKPRLVVAGLIRITCWQ